MTQFQKGDRVHLNHKFRPTAIASTTGRVVLVRDVDGDTIWVKLDNRPHDAIYEYNNDWWELDLIA